MACSKMLQHKMQQRAHMRNFMAHQRTSKTALIKTQANKIAYIFSTYGRLRSEN